MLILHRRRRAYRAGGAGCAGSGGYGQCVVGRRRQEVGFVFCVPQRSSSSSSLVRSLVREIVAREDEEVAHFKDRIASALEVKSEGRRLRKTDWCDQLSSLITNEAKTLSGSSVKNGAKHH